MLCESVAALSDPQHHVPGNWIAQLLSDVARVFRALAPVIRVVEDGYAHDCVTLSAFRPARSAELASRSPPKRSAIAMLAANSGQGAAPIWERRSRLRGWSTKGYCLDDRTLMHLPRQFDEAIHRASDARRAPCCCDRGGGNGAWNNGVAVLVLLVSGRAVRERRPSGDQNHDPGNGCTKYQ
jgi:hypothetical protein